MLEMCVYPAGDLRIIDHWALVEEWAARAAAKGRGSPEMDGTN